MNKKKMLSLLLTGCMLVGMLPAAWAVEEPAPTESPAPEITHVAQIGETKYETLGAAIQAATDENATDTAITLLDDAAVSEKITINKTVSIDGNNHTVTGTTDDASVYFEITDGTVTVKNMTLTNFGDTAATVGATGVFKIPGTAAADTKLIGEGLTVKLFNRGAFDIRNGSLEAKDCTIECDNKADNRLNKGILFGAEENGIGSGTVTNCKITGVNSTYEGWSSNGIEIQAGSEVAITGCEISSTKGGISVARNYGTGAATVTVTDTTINSTDYAVRIFESGGTSEAVEGSSATVTIEGGSYTGDVRVSVKDSTESDGSSTISITGGTFSVDPSKFVAEGYVAVKKSDSSYEVSKFDDVCTASLDMSKAGGITASGSGKSFALAGDVDMRTYAVTDATLKEDFETLLVEQRTVPEIATLADTVDIKYVDGNLNLVFATIQFQGLEAAQHYYVVQSNPALSTVYPEDTNLADNTKEKVYTGAVLTEGLNFMVSDQSGDITFKLAPCEEGADTLPSGAATVTLTNGVKFIDSPIPGEGSTTVEVKPTITPGNPGETASVTATVSAVTESNIAAAAGTENKTLTIDASQVGTEVVGKAEVTLDKAVVDALAGEAAKDITTEIKTPVGTVKLPAKAVELMKNESNPAVLTVEKAAAPTAATAIAQFDVKVEVDSAAVEIKDLTTPITLSFFIGKGLTSNPALVYVDGDTLKPILNYHYDPASGIITGTTDHLSTFAAVPTVSGATETGGIGQKLTLTATKEHYLTVQVAKGGTNSIYTVKVPEDGTVELYVANGSTVDVWETTGIPAFTDGAFNPNGYIGHWSNK